MTEVRVLTRRTLWSVKMWVNVLQTVLMQLFSERRGDGEMYSSQQ